LDACYKIKLLLKLLHTIYIFKNKWYLKHNSFEVLCKIWEKIQFLRRAFPLTIFCVLLRQASFFCLFIITLKFMFDQFFSFSAFRFFLWSDNIRWLAPFLSLYTWGPEDFLTNIHQRWQRTSTSLCLRRHSFLKCKLCEGSFNKKFDFIACV